MKSRRLTWDEIDDAIGSLKIQKCPKDNTGDRVALGNFITGCNLEEIQSEVEFYAEQAPDDCGRCDHGFSCPSVADTLFSQASWQTLGRLDRRAIGYVYDRRLNVVYRITAQANFEEVESLLRRLIE